jgi:hypothetical protein
MESSSLGLEIFLTVPLANVQQQSNFFACPRGVVSDHRTAGKRINKKFS